MKITAVIFFLFFLKIYSCYSLQNNNQSNNSPNIIVILVDDLGYADVGFNACKDIATPNIDRIADEGVIFTNAYATYAVCGPSRAGLITGRYQDRFGFGRNPLFTPNDDNMGVPKTEEMLSEALNKADYKSIAIGKWHLGAHKSLRPTQRGFDDFYGFLSGGHSYFPELWTLQDEYDVETQFDAYHTKLLRNDTRVEEDEYLTDAFSREAVNYINKYKNQPFFMYLAYNAPHTPLQATQKYLDRFSHIKDEKRRTYAAMVGAVDDGVGEILNTLDNLELSQNTLIFFLSDNGGPENNNGSDNGVLRGGKSDLFEGGIRVPFAMRWPTKIPKGMKYGALVSALDIFATAIAQSKKPVITKNKLDGVNLIPYVLGDTMGSPHEFLYWRKYDHQEFAVRTHLGQKLITLKYNANLFDLNDNIGENHAYSIENSRLLEVLQTNYGTWSKQIIDPIFLGLSSDDQYTIQHPDRFTKPE